MKKCPRLNKAGVFIGPPQRWIQLGQNRLQHLAKQHEGHQDR
jgi:hypothetical protein